ncbi:ectoine/hydroxyectoine ABC transporter permease subunit EhuC [Nocardiopsis sp. NPDC049922]|uniref:ectoine/hydroxyectoine ABC transporter permease subunit EhuC n=1 Tax=Nocardiopsis sp. NPDC049922 TaxID=3155157 RepID=UPI0033EBA105
MDFLAQQLPRFVDGAVATVILTLGGSALAFVLAMFFGILGTVRSGVLRAVAVVYVETFRGVAALVVMFWLAFALPQLTGFRLDDYFTGILALGLNVGAYGAEVVRGAIQAVPKAQIEATVALNMSWQRRMRSVVIPQAWAQMLPTFGNLIIELMKASAVVYTIGILDITAVARLLRSTGDLWWAFGTAFVLYYVIAHLLSGGVRVLERRANRKLGRLPAARKAAKTPLRVPAGGGGDA